MKRFKNLAAVLVTLFFVSAFSGCDVYSYIPQVSQTRYENPQWAPPYYQGVRYYYLPDIEAYYDLSARQFVYLSNGRWYDSPECPSVYAGFDLNDCFSIALDINVYQPWMHHQYYVSHYPRYYYRDYYDHSNIPYVRGFNENSKSAIYWSENQRNRARSWDNENLKSNRQFKYTPDDRKQQYNWSSKGTSTRSTDDNNRRNDQNSWNSNSNNTRSSNNGNVYQQQDNKNNGGNTNRPSHTDNGNSQSQNNGNKNGSSNNDNNTNRQYQNNGNSNGAPTRTAGTETNNHQQNTNTESTRTVRSTNYYGRTIGQPVKVEKQMRQQPRTPTTDTKDTRSAGSRNEQNNQERR